MSLLSALSFTDTIVSIATPAGKGALGVIRLSGKESINIVASLFSKSLSSVKGGTFHYGVLRYEGERIDDVIVSLFRAPHSYTGEEVVELSCHGSPYILQRVVEVLCALGARPAEEGEFTRRAFMNGKMDLLQAEAVADIIAAETRAQKEQALQQKSGILSNLLRQLREEFIVCAALMETQLDFSEEAETQSITHTQIQEKIVAVKTQIQDLVASFREGKMIKEGVSVVLVGAPNAGKSTLLNAILEEDRALVSEEAGTTRDTIEEMTYYKGIAFRWIDTAGLREAQNDIEKMGIERSYTKIKQADLVVLLFDASALSIGSLADREDFLRNIEKPYILVANKMDLVPEGLTEKIGSFKEHPICIAAKNREGVDALLEKIYTHTIATINHKAGAIIFNTRHQHLLKAMLDHIEQMEEGLKKNIPYDLLHTDIKYCLHYIAELTGEVKTDAVLDYIFSKFCIGK